MHEGGSALLKAYDLLLPRFSCSTHGFFFATSSAFLHYLFFSRFFLRQASFFTGALVALFLYYHSNYHGPLQDSCLCLVWGRFIYYTVYR